MSGGETCGVSGFAPANCEVSGFAPAKCAKCEMSSFALSDTVDSENIGPYDMVTIVLYDFSLLDLSYTVRIDDDEQSTTKIKVRTVDLWPLFGDERFLEEPPFGTTTPTLKKLNDAALTLASMLVTDAEYRVMRKAPWFSPSHRRLLTAGTAS